MATFGSMSNRILSDASLQRFGMTAAMVLPWLISIYEELITCLPMSETTRSVGEVMLIPGPYDTSTFSYGANSDFIFGNGTTWTTALDHWYLREHNNETWYHVLHVFDTQHLQVAGFGHTHT